MKDEYIRARKAALKAYRKAEDAGENPYPAVLDELADTDSLPTVYAGLIQIPADLIIGTKTAARQNAFACNFMPLFDADSEFGRKWTALYESQIEEGIRDPVRVCEYLHRFYVQEGNKRVSVLKYLEMPVIAAEVMRILPAEENPLYEAFLEFYRVCPLYELDFSHPEDYLKFAELMGQDLTHPWDDKLRAMIRSAYENFRRVYAQNSEKIDNVSDAFLLYISVYGIEGVRYHSAPLIRRKLAAIRSELRLKSTDDNIVVKENPQPKKEGLLSDLSRMIPRYTASKPLRLSFIYDSTPEESAWIYDHEVGRRYLNQKFEGVVQTEAYENRKDGKELSEALETAAKNSDAVFTVSPVQAAETLKAAVRHPGVKFLSCSLFLPVKSVRAYYVRMYEVRFLLGALAAMLSRSHKICYIADYPIYGTAASINAFAIGASLIDPEAKIYLGWSGVNDQDWQKELKYLDADIFLGPDLAKLSEDSTVFGLCRIDENGEIRNLAMPVINWAKYYELLVQSILDGGFSSDEEAGNDKAVNYWWGLDSGAADLVISSSVPYSSVKMINMMKKALIAGTLSPFSHELRSQNGIIQNEKSGRLSNEEIIRMNWLNENVIGVIPEYDQLSESGRQLTRVSGIDTVRNSR